MKWLLIFLFIIVVVATIFFWSSKPKLLEVRVETTLGTKVFAVLPGGEEEYLKNISIPDDGPIIVAVPIDATNIILRYNSQEKVYSHTAWKEGKIVHGFLDRVSIDADPDAEVFIIRTGTDAEEFIDDVPLTMDISIGTTIILRHQGEEKVILYKQGTKKPIYHKFSP